MTISFYPYVWRDGAWRFPEGRERGSDPNYANANAAILLEDLGLSTAETLWDADPVPLDTFEQALRLETWAVDGKPSPAVEPRVRPGPGVTITECGQREGRKNERLAELAALVVRARALGATQIGWG